MDYLIVKSPNAKSPYLLVMSDGFSEHREKMLEEIQAPHEIEDVAIEKLSFLVAENLQQLKNNLLYLFSKPQISKEERLLGLWSYWMQEIIPLSPSEIARIKDLSKIIDSMNNSWVM